MSISRTSRQSAKVARVLLANPSELRHLTALWSSRNKSTLEMEVPWLPFSAIEYLDGQIDGNSKVFEFGGGGSTLWLAKRAEQTVTVEHDDEWVSYLRKALGPYPNAKMLTRSSSDDFREYVSTIDSFPDETFDLVIVDGRRRVLCAEHAIKKLRVGGLLVLDDSERTRYMPVHKNLASWVSRSFNGFGPAKAGGSRTTIWEKPHN